jgi:hypothetical protein
MASGSAGILQLLKIALAWLLPLQQFTGGDEALAGLMPALSIDASNRCAPGPQPRFI